MSLRQVIIPPFHRPGESGPEQAMVTFRLVGADGDSIISYRAEDGDAVAGQEFVIVTDSAVALNLTPTTEIPGSHYRVVAQVGQRKDGWDITFGSSATPLTWAEIVDSATPLDPAEVSSLSLHLADTDQHLQPGDRAAIDAVSLPSVEAAEDLLAGQPLRLDGTGKAVLARADMAGQADVAALAGADTLAGVAVALTRGRVTRADWTAITGAAALAPGALYYLDPAAPGQLTQTPPGIIGQYLTRIGRALDSQTFQAAIEPPVLL